MTIAVKTQCLTILPTCESNLTFYYISIHLTNFDADLHTNFKSEDEKAIIAEIAKLMVKIQRLHERELRAEQQAQAVAERSARKRELNENVRM